MYMLKNKDLKPLLNRWAKEALLFAPQLEEDQVMLLPYTEGKFTMDYINFAFPVKEYMFRQREILFNWSNCNGNMKVEIPGKQPAKTVYFGVRPCDAYGIKYLDKFFLEGYRDEFYGSKRDEAIIAAVNCTLPGEHCFCGSMGTGPFAESGYDLLFTSLQGDYLVEAGTEKGRELLTASKDLFTAAGEGLWQEKEAVRQAALSSFKTRIDSENISKLLEINFNNPIWQELSKECISCTGCTSVCPTCTCFNVVEEKTGDCCGCRVRYWDSCQNDSFTRNAREHNPRSSKSRFRYRIYDKFKYIEDRFGVKGCTGCGRCTEVCPASISLVDIIKQLSENEKDIGGE